MSVWTSARNVIEQLAPTIATVLGGPLAGGALSALEGVFGLTGNSNQSDTDRQNALAAAISGATPDQLAAMRKADQDYAVAMAQAGFKDKETLAQLTASDRDSARKMQIATKSYIAPFLALLVTFGFFGILGSMMFITMPAATHDALMLMLGSLGTAWGSVMAYYFGSSLGNDRQHEILASHFSPNTSNTTDSTNS